MADTIIFRAPRQEPAGAAIGEGVAIGLQGLSQAIFTYANARKQENLEKIAIFDKLLQTYKDQAPQSMMQEYDKTLRDQYKVGLPRDPATGDFMTPTPTVQEQIARASKDNPQLLSEAVQRQLTGMSPTQQKFKLMELQRKQDHDTIMEHLAEARNHIAELRLMQERDKAKKGSEPSDSVMLPDGSIKGIAEVMDPVTGQVPPGTVHMSVDQAKVNIARINAQNTKNYRDLMAQAATTRLELEKMRVTVAFNGQAETQLLNAGRLWANPKWDPTPEQEERVYNALRFGLLRAGVEEQDIDTFLPRVRTKPGLFAEAMNKIFGGPTGEKLDQERTLHGIDTPPVEGQRRSSSGRLFNVERLDDDEYNKRMRELTTPQPQPSNAVTPTTPMPRSETVVPTTRGKSLTSLSNDAVTNPGSYTPGE